MISSIVFVNFKGEILIYRIFKDDITRAETMQFCTRIVARQQNKESPIINIDGTSFIHISHQDIILLATTQCNVNVAMTIQFLYQLINICKAYFGELDENAIKKQFVLIYEILDEVMDYGIPQIMDPDVLKRFIQEGGLQPEIMNDIAKLKQLTSAATGATPWRIEGIVHKKNEKVNVLMSVQGTILRAQVSGEVQVRAMLSGMPECQFGMNDKLLMSREPPKAGQTTGDQGISIDDVKFHQCVKLPQYDKERAITFTPPDGAFELMTYRITENINIPFKIIPIIKVEGQKMEVHIKLKSIFDSTHFATNVAVQIPCPKNTAVVNAQTQLGRAKFEPDQGGIIWRIQKFPGDQQAMLNCDIDLGVTTNEKTWVQPPITIDFQVPMFTASGLRVRFFRVQDQSGYKPSKWIRYITKAGDYQHRL